ncbi:MAG: hypothetical protein R3202_11090, partial [Candidatus Competibacterales bacterium]|nr:hypothetical protein [Candidatus Competibacterales bacterium]
MTISRLQAPILALAAACLLAGCIGGAYRYQMLDTEALRSRAETQTQGPIRVSAAVPGREETASIYGIDLYDQGIQPVWLEIANSGDALARYAPVSTDREYFAPLEVAYMNRGGYSDDARESMNTRFRRLAMPRYIDPGETRSGFVLTHADPGAKAFNVDVFSAGELRDFTFLLRVPGFKPDYARLDLPSMYTDEEIVDYEADALQEP